MKTSTAVSLKFLKKKVSKKENNSNLCHLQGMGTFVHDITIGKCQMLFIELKALETKNGIIILCNINF